MRKKIAVIICSLLFAVPVPGFAMGKREAGSDMPAYDHADEKARFKRSEDQFNSEVNKNISAEKQAEKEAAEAAEARKKAEEAQDKGEGQFKVKF
jgi:hypothetical protein